MNMDIDTVKGDVCAPLPPPSVRHHYPAGADCQVVLCNNDGLLSGQHGDVLMLTGGSEKCSADTFNFVIITLLTLLPNLCQIVKVY